MEYFVYILKSKKDDSLYTGYTKDIKERLKMHNRGKVFSTKRKIPFEMMYFERHTSLAEALAREKWLKSSKAKNLRLSLKSN